MSITSPRSTEERVTALEATLPLILDKIDHIGAGLSKISGSIDDKISNSATQSTQTWRWAAGMGLVVIGLLVPLLHFALNSTVEPIKTEIGYLPTAMDVSAMRERLGGLEARVDVLQGVTPTAAASPLMDRLTIDLQRVLDRQDRQIAWMMQVSALLDSHGVKPPKVPTE